ncbi:hypothetical protein C8J57DRAFT_172448 [Mycena rebaudengoi]|nr:hypothetical protein C8J57DRAFT_172448 [Mycena rebaudengoi]
MILSRQGHPRVDNLTFKLRSISPNLWPIFELTYELFKSDTVDFLEEVEMLPSLENFVSYGSDVIKTRPDYMRMLLDIYTISITSEQLGENDRINGCKLAESILLNLRGSADEALQPIITAALGQLDKSETAALRLANLEVLINAVLYNPAAALHIMESARVLRHTVCGDRGAADEAAARARQEAHDPGALCTARDGARRGARWARGRVAGDHWGHFEDLQGFAQHD